MGIETLHTAQRTVRVVLDGQPVERSIEFKMLELSPVNHRAWSGLASAQLPGAFDLITD
jgi:hypothetical protein